jgi:hypothetical protein
MGVEPVEKDGITVWQATEQGLIPREEMLESYVENLKIVDENIVTLVHTLEGKTVISADHGENLGEREFGVKFYGHANETKYCRFVPWLELEYDMRKQTEASKPVKDLTPGDGVVNRRLEEHGYLWVSNSASV